MFPLGPIRRVRSAIKYFLKGDGDTPLEFSLLFLEFKLTRYDHAQEHQMGKANIRWQQRSSNFEAAYAHLASAVQLSGQRPLSELEKQGLIQAFEFTHEVAWQVLKDYFEYQSATQISGSRDAAREGFQKGLLKDGNVWMEMIKSRNQTSHSYNKSTADEIVEKINTSYSKAFADFQSPMKSLSQKP